MAATVVQNLWDRCHSLSRMSERKDVHDGAAASLSMQQPLTLGINLMNHATANGLPSCETYTLFRHGPLLPKLINLPSSIDPFVKIPVPVTSQYPYKRATKLSYPPACP